VAHDMEYEVGYRKPPKAFQFQKGRSGNASGRPRKVLGIAEVFWKVANQKVLVHGKNGPRYMTKLEACATQLGNKGTAGDLKAVKDFIQMLAHFPLAGATQKDMEATASSAKAKLLALLEARDGSLAEDAAECDQPSGQANAIPHECDISRESSEKSGRRHPQFPSVGEHYSAGPLDHRPALNSTSQPPPASPVPPGGRDSLP
jgi:Family of unknown function (DUF5681)